MPRPDSIYAVDLFCGAGGLTRGLLDGGVQVVAGLDSDPLCQYPYEQNNKTRFIHADVSKLSGKEVAGMFPDHGIKLLAGCAPCQPFSPLGRTRVARHLPETQLLKHFARIINQVRPDLVLMENVRNVKTRLEYAYFDKMLRKLGYAVSVNDVNAHEYGVAQSRTRLVVLASKLGIPELVKPEPQLDGRPFVEDVIRDNLEPLKAGEGSRTDEMHSAKRLTHLNIKRIRASRQGGTWHDWPKSLWLRCHKKESGSRYLAVYGRMSWSLPSPTITTEFGNLGSGRFGHPEQDRAITPREAALLQSFSIDYDFLQPGLKFSHERVARWIGNAFPVKVGGSLAASVRRHTSVYT
jgi:DNA (cytosine-5)-methyltransferase 1